MRFRNLLLILSQRFKPDKDLYHDIAEDLRKLGIMSVGGGIAGFLLQASWTALLLLTVGCIIWSFGLFVASRAKADARQARDE